MNKHKKQSAFTLVELIVVITILAILGTIAFISLQGYSSQSRDSVRISDMSSMKTGLELFNLDAGKYPSPSDETIITYSGATVWTQGYFGEQTTKNIDKLDKIPTDPLTDKKYVYSTTNTRQEFQLAGAMEGDEVSFNLSQQEQPHPSPLLRGEGIVQASEKTARLKISGNYNGKVLKVLTGSTSYVLAVPSIITSSGTTLENITTNNFLAYNGYKNLPFQYAGTYKTDGEINLNLVNSGSIVVYQGDLLTLSDTTQTGIDARKTLIQKLQNAYSGTTIKNVGEISTILLTNTTDTNTTEAISTALVSYNLGGSILATNITYNTCSFSGATLNHDENVTAYNEQTILWNASYDCTNRQITRTCNNGTLSGSGAYQYGSCVKGTATNCSSNGAYIYNTHTYSIPALTHGTSTGTILSTTVNENNGAFKYTLDNITCNDGVLASINENVAPTVISCDAGYTQSGNTCVLDTSWCAYGSTPFTNALGWTNTELKYDAGTNKCYVFGDENANAQNACNKWITDNVTLGGSWIWVPARNFVTDGHGTDLKNAFYQREVTYNSHTYVCRGFAVMKYEAKFTSTSGKTQPNPTDWATWATSDYATDNDTFPETINSGITSKSADNPIAYIRQGEAIDACKGSTSNQYHLITNNEWMAVARNIEAQTVNLKDGNKLYRGLDGGNGQYNEDGTLGCGKTGGQTTYWTAPAGTDNNSLSSIRSSCDDMRQNKLSNGALVWDISGNVWEHVNKSNVANTSNSRTTNSGWNTNSYSTEAMCSNGTWDWRGWNGTDAQSIGACTMINGYTQASYGPLNNWNADNGVGRIYANNAEDRDNVFLRGADGDAGTYSGVFTLYLLWVAAHRDYRVGFRCSW